MPSCHELMAIIIRTCTLHIPLLLSYLAQLTSFKGLIVPASFWTQLECHTGLIVSCFPAVNQIVRHWVVRGDNSAQGNGGASWMLRRAIPGMYSIDTISTDRGMNGQIAGAHEGIEFMEMVPGEGIAVPGKRFKGLWGRDCS